jgi:hypothetical protein
MIVPVDVAYWPEAVDTECPLYVRFKGVERTRLLPLSSSGCDPGCVKTSSQVCVASQFAGAIDEAVH